MTDKIAGKTESLRATVREIERYLDGESYTLPNSKNRSDLNVKLAELSEWWFKEGFAIAHKICVERLRNGDPIDGINFEHDCVWLAPNMDRAVKLSAPAADRPDASWGL